MLYLTVSCNLTQGDTYSYVYLAQVLPTLEYGTF